MQLFKGKRWKAVAARATVNSKCFARATVRRDGKARSRNHSGFGCQSGNLAAALDTRVLRRVEERYENSKLTFIDNFISGGGMGAVKFGDSTIEFEHRRQSRRRRRGRCPKLAG